MDFHWNEIEPRGWLVNRCWADLFGPLTMPPALLKAHQKPDIAVDAAYQPSGGKKSCASDAERVTFLFQLYQRITGLLPKTTARKTRKPSVQKIDKYEWVDPRSKLEFLME
jgi:hypothetical protein